MLFRSNTAFTASATFPVAYIASGSQTAIGNITFSAAGQTPSAPTSGAVTLLAGYVLQVAAPSSADSTAADIVLTIPCVRS